MIYEMAFLCFSKVVNELFSYNPKPGISAILCDQGWGCYHLNSEMYPSRDCTVDAYANLKLRVFRWRHIAMINDPPGWYRESCNLCLYTKVAFCYYWLVVRCIEVITDEITMAPLKEYLSLFLSYLFSNYLLCGASSTLRWSRADCIRPTSSPLDLWKISYTHQS